jgi:hypothetical protein
MQLYANKIYRRVSDSLSQIGAVLQKDVLEEQRENQLLDRVGERELVTSNESHT